MNSSGHKASKVLLLVAGVCLGAQGLCGADSTTASTPKPAARPVVRTTPVRPVAKKTSTPVRHTAAVRQTAPHSTATHSATLHAATSRPGANPAAHRYTATARNRPPARTTTHRAPTHTYRPVRPLTGQQRLARIHLEPERAQEIQQALIREGYLQDGDATGLWDTRTHDAMMRYQMDHGFPATGLPEAKSLMKLGLGSHPLPPELDHGPAGVSAQAGAEGSLAGPSDASPPISEASSPSEQ